MEFYSLEFVLFMAAVLILYYLAYYIAPKIQWVFLLIASLLFYYACVKTACLFILFTAFTIWLAGLLFDKSRKVEHIERSLKTTKDENNKVKTHYKNMRRLVFWVTLAMNFGVLFYFKYWNSILNLFIGHSSALSLLIPLGISFYTFQSISYLIDVSNNDYPPEKNYFRFLLFVSFFPQLIQGPINRFDKLGNQLTSNHKPDIEAFRRAFYLFGFGLLKKYAIADCLSTTVGMIFDVKDPTVPGSVVVFGILLYSIQQYADFSGGIDMALGISEAFGISMEPNFRQPYFAVSLADFWRRWHITLGTWMRDYVFYPFALSKPMQRFGKRTTKWFGRYAGRVLPGCVANILVFLVVGLWHGLEEHFIMWGLYNGLVIAISSLLLPLFISIGSKFPVKLSPRIIHILRIIRTFIIVNIGWYFDRISDVSYRIICFANTVTNFRLDLFSEKIRSYNMTSVIKPYAIAALALVVVIVNSVSKEKGINTSERLIKISPVYKSVLFAFLITLVFIAFSINESTGGFMYAVY